MSGYTLYMFCAEEHILRLLYLYVFRCYDVASLDTLPQCVGECWELLRSESFFLLLSNFTGLQLHYLCPADDEDEDKEEDEDVPESGEATGSSTESRSVNASRKKGACQFLQTKGLYLCVCGF